MLNQTLSNDRGLPATTSVSPSKRRKLTADQRAIVRHQFETNPKTLDIIAAVCQRLLGIEISARQIYEMARTDGWLSPVRRRTQARKWSIQDVEKDTTARDTVTPCNNSTAGATCMWVIGQRPHVGSHYCRQPVAEGYAFCADHCHVAYTAWPKPRDQEGF